MSFPALMILLLITLTNTIQCELVEVIDYQTQSFSGLLNHSQKKGNVIHIVTFYILYIKWVAFDKGSRKKK